MSPKRERDSQAPASSTKSSEAGNESFKQAQARQTARKRAVPVTDRTSERKTTPTKRVASEKRTGVKPRPSTRTGERVRTSREGSAENANILNTLLANKALLAIAALVALLLVLFMMRSCGSTEQQTTGSEDTSTPATTPAIDVSTTYDWNNLTRENGRYIYSLDGQVVSRFGIDVSENNAEIDWPSVASDGVEFAFIRVGYRGNEEGDIHLDEQFKANLEGARAAGIDVGVYFYSQAITEEEAREEARYVIEQLEGSELEYPIAFDSETHPEQDVRTDNTPRGELAAVAKAFCEEVRAAGYKPLIYGSSNDLARYKRDHLTAYPVWYAEYAGLPDPPSGFTFWQFHNDGIISGITTPVDVNLDLTKAAELQAGKTPAGDEATSSSATSEQ